MSTETQSPVEQQIEGNWNQFKCRVQAAWGELTNDDTDVAEGRLDQLIGNIQERTGEARQEIRRKLDEIAHELRN